MWCYHRMLKKLRVEVVTSNLVFKSIKKNWQLWQSTQTRRDKMIGYVLRHDSLPKTIIEGDVEGHIWIGRPKNGIDYTNLERHE